MFATTKAFISLGLILRGVRGQVSTASIFPVGFENDGLQGEMVGAGPDGTTFVLSGTFATFGLPFTMTLVEDATHVEEIANIATGTDVIQIAGACDFVGNNIACAEVIAADGSSTTIQQSGQLALVPVPVSTGGVGAKSSGLTTVVPPVTTVSVSGGNPIQPPSSPASILPPVLSSSLTTPPATSPTVAQLPPVLSTSQPVLNPPASGAISSRILSTQLLGEVVLGLLVAFGAFLVVS